MNTEKPQAKNHQTGSSLIEALAAIIIIGVGIALFLKVQSNTSRESGRNSKMLIAGKMLEKFLEDTRIAIRQDPIRNWPPKDSTVPAATGDSITLKSKISDAFSPSDGSLVLNVKQIQITAKWKHPRSDSLSITTYVAKQF